MRNYLFRQPFGLPPSPKGKALRCTAKLQFLCVTAYYEIQLALGSQFHYRGTQESRMPYQPGAHCQPTAAVKAFSSFRQFPIANLRVQPLFCMLADKSPSLRQSAKAPPRLSPGTALSWLLCKAIPHNGCCLKERESAASGRASAPPGCCWRCGWPPPWSRRPWRSPTSRPCPLCAGSATGAGGPVRSVPPAPAP